MRGDGIERARVSVVAFLRREMADYAEYKYLLLKEKYENGKHIE